MTALWLRDWKKYKTNILLRLGAVWFLAVIFLVLYLLAGERLAGYLSGIFSIPPQIYSLLGFTKPVPVNQFTFFISFFLMSANVWMMWNGCRWAVRIMRCDEQTGSMLGMCNQLYGRTRLMSIKYLETVGGFFLYYLLMFAGILLLVRIGDSKQAQLAENMERFRRLMLLGAATGMLFASITFLYAIYSKKSTMKGTSTFRLLLVFGLWMCGNLYKIFNLLALMMERLERPAEWLTRASGLLRHLYWISPLSWLNPYADITDRILCIQVGICVAGSVLCFGLGILGYRKRNFS